MKTKQVRIWTTLSFRSACRYGVAHLAGQPVELHPAGAGYVIYCREGRLGLCYSPKSLRQRGGVIRDAELHYPTRSRRA